MFVLKFMVIFLGQPEKSKMFDKIKCCQWVHFTNDPN